MSERSDAAAAELAEARKNLPEQAQPIEDDAPLNAVIIVRTQDEEGNIGTDVFVNGDVRATEAQTIIELGLVTWRTKIGLNG